MSLASINQAPLDYITYAGRNVGEIRIPVFETMLAKLFTQIDRNSADAFRGFYNVAHAPGQERLLAPFYKAVRQGFERIKAGSPASGQPWGQLFEGITDLIEADPVLTRDVNDRLLGIILPHAIRHTTSTDADWQAASDILRAAGRIQAVADAVDPRLPHDIVKWHLRQCGHDFSLAAGRLTDLRATPAFAPSIAAIENHAGIHVTAQPASVKSDPRALTSQSRLLVLRFEQAHNHVVALSLDPSHKGHPAEQIGLSGQHTRYRGLWSNMLMHEYCADSQDQPWVAPIAISALTALEA